MRTDVKYSRHSLKANQAFIGDPEKIGLSKQEYKNAKKRLKKYGLVLFEPSNKGTIATLISTEVYDINADEPQLEEPANLSLQNKEKEPSKNQQETSKEPSNIHLASTEDPLTRMKEKKEIKEETTTTVAASDELYACLQKISGLTLEGKRSLMAYPENRVRMALEWSSKTVINKSLIGALHWHCKQENPPLLKLAVGQSQQQSLAWEYNQFLEDQGFIELSSINQSTIPNNVAHVIANGKLHNN